MSESVSSVKTNININFTWWDATGSLPDEHNIDTLHELAIRQVAQAVLNGERKGRLDASLPHGDKTVRYEGEWDLEPNWRLKSRRK